MLNSPATESEQKDVLNRRLSRLADGVAILRVGGATEDTDKVGDAVDDKTGGKFSSQVDKGRDALKAKLGDL